MPLSYTQTATQNMPKGMSGEEPASNGG
jgi:hypothetical protein